MSAPDLIDLPTFSDAPFHCPVDGLTVDLPFPPSVNRLWRNSGADGTSRVHLSPSYLKWKDAADAMLLATKGWRGKTIRGAFSAEIGLGRPPKGQSRGDLDNRIKAVCDYLQRVEIIENDKHCQRLVIAWVDPSRAPTGCRVTVKACA